MAKKKKLRTWSNPGTDKGSLNEEKSATMPDMANDPRVILENHVRGINPITGAVLDRQRYYGDAIMPYGKDLTYEELRIKRKALEAKIEEINQSIKDAKTAERDQADNGSAGTETMGTDQPVQTNSGETQVKS